MRTPRKKSTDLTAPTRTGNPMLSSLSAKSAIYALKAFRETMKRVGVTYDSWDWESDFVWSTQVSEVMQKLKTSPFVFSEKGVLEFDAEKVTQVLDLKGKLGLSENNEVPPLTLVRADGTTLYTTRDIAYTLWKFKHAQKVINVIGMEQSLAQLQLKIALYALGYGEYADNLVHFAYNLVTLPGYKMSSRRGHYITFDDGSRRSGPTSLRRSFEAFPYAFRGGET